MSRTVAGHKNTVKQIARKHAADDYKEASDTLRHWWNNPNDATHTTMGEKRLKHNFTRKQNALRAHMAPHHYHTWPKKGTTNTDEKAKVKIGGTPSRKTALKAAHDEYKFGGPGYKAAMARLRRMEQQPTTRLAVKPKKLHPLLGATKTIVKRK
jgi:hypothetical protein